MNSGDGSAKPAATVDRWLHCNACYTVPDAGGGNHYYFVSCGHIFCRNCCAKGAELAKAATCLLCKKTQVQYMDINRNIQTKFRNLFRPLKDVAQECMTEMQRVIEFQQRHKNGLVRHFSDKNQKAVTFAKSVRGELEKQKGREQQFVKERTELLKHVERLRKENEQLKSQMERLRHQPLPQPDYMSAAPGKTPDSGLGTNDSLSLSFIETVTSTPIIEQGPNTRRHLAAAFQTSSGSVPSPICSANRLLTTPAMLGLSKTPHAFHTRELVTPRSAVPYEKVGLSGGMRIVEERRVLTDRRPKSKKQNGSRGQNSDDYMEGIS